MDRRRGHRELARVRTPDTAVAFVERFGPLHASSLYASKEPRTTVRESFTLFESYADELIHILFVADLVRKGTDGNTAAISSLRDLIVIPEDRLVPDPDKKSRKRPASEVYTPYERFVGADDRTILMYAHERGVAEPLSEGMADSRTRVEDRAYAGESMPPGKLRIGIRADSLLSVCYLSVALTLAGEEPVAFCADPECGRPFCPADKRQRFCSRACGNRVRYQRFMSQPGRDPAQYHAMQRERRRKGE